MNVQIHSTDVFAHGSPLFGNGVNTAVLRWKIFMGAPERISWTYLVDIVHREKVISAPKFTQVDEDRGKHPATAVASALANASVERSGEIFPSFLTSDRCFQLNGDDPRTGRNRLIAFLQDPKRLNVLFSDALRR
jgi:hypothetical protein